MEERRIPGKMEKRNMFYIHKKGEVDKEENYKGITLLNLATKVYKAVLIERLRKKSGREKLLPETQARFRKKRETIDNIYIHIKSFSGKRERKRKKVIIRLICRFKSSNQFSRQKIIMVMDGGRRDEEGASGKSGRDI